MSDDLYEELPREEALVRLYELRNAVSQRAARRRAAEPSCEAERHHQEHGHVLAFGCCRVVDDAS